MHRLAVFARLALAYKILEKGEFMAERRMFSKTIVDSDAFLDMPVSTQCLYFHLSMRADDEGFVNNPKRIQRMVGMSDDDMRILIAKQFIIPFESGICVIKHWFIHNYIRNDRFKSTSCVEEKSQLALDGNKTYCLTDGMTNGIPSADQMETQYRIGKDSIGEIEESNSLRSLSSSCPEPSAENSGKTADSPVFIEFETNKTDVLYPVTVEFVSQMKELYPAVDVEQELRNMKAWLMSNPQRRKTFKGMPKFINSWLAREQDKGFVSPQVQKPARTAPDYTPGFKVEEEVMDLGR